MKTNQILLLIVLVGAVGIGGLVMLALLAAIALPAYQDYVKRAKAAQGQSPGQATAEPQASVERTFDADRMADEYYKKIYQ